MHKLNRIFLLAAFVFAMGCGEQSVGKTDQSAAQPAAPATEAVQVAEASVPSSNGAPLVYIEGTHYERLPAPVATADSSRIEVAEVFWYGCGHCYVFESKFAPWKKKQADDVVVVKSPAIWDNRRFDSGDPARYTTPMANHARIYYTAKALGVLDKITPAAFLALHNNHRGLQTEDEIRDFFTDNGVPEADFDRTFNSFAVTSAVRQAEDRQEKYQIQGTPELVVDGTYRITGRMVGSQDAMLSVADFLVAKIRRTK
jgi:protein dithiol oxidoreductase (disulfide-forming)